MQARPGVRVPGSWDGFELATRAILGQQVTVKGATNLAGRLVRAFGRPMSSPNRLTHLFPRPEVLANTRLASIGLPAARAEAIRRLARSVCDHEIDFDSFGDADTLMGRLGEIAGIGKWTVQYVAMRALGEPDAFPSGDIGLLHALHLNSTREMELRAEKWRPWRACAAVYLWSSAAKAPADPV